MHGYRGWSLEATTKWLSLNREKLPMKSPLKVVSLNPSASSSPASKQPRIQCRNFWTQTDFLNLLFNIDLLFF